jgi:ketosteroid isomerase-like protein
MDTLWAHDATVTLILPSNKTISVGWDAVRKIWEAQNANLSALKLTQLDGPYIQVKGDVAWQTGLVNSDATLKSGGSRNRPVVDMTVFEKRDGTWLVVSDTAQWTPQ